MRHALLTLSACLCCLSAPAQISLDGPMAQIFNMGSCLDPATDNFNRANNSTLGANWATTINPDSTVLQIVGNAVQETVENGHAFSTWIASPCMSQDQYSQIRLSSLGAWTGVSVRTQPGVDNFYFGFLFATYNAPTNDYRFYLRKSGAYFDYFNPNMVTFTTNDQFTMEVRGVNPVCLYIYQNAACVGEWLDWTNLITGGYPGAGLYSPSGQHLNLDDWKGGSIAWGSPVDTFVRPNGLLGSNWVSTFYGNATHGGTVYNSETVALWIQGNVATVSAVNRDTAALWGKPQTVNQYSEVQMQAQASGDYAGCVARSTLNNTGNTWYEAVVAGALGSATTYIFEFDGVNYHVLWNDTGSAWSAGDTLRLEVTGTNPVQLVVKHNGTTLQTFNDSLYKLTGTYAGMACFDNGTHVVGITHWDCGGL